MRLLVVGARGGTHVGESFLRAALRDGLDAAFVDVTAAYDGPRVLRSLWWRFLDRRPYRLERFGREVLARAKEHRAEVVLTTGLSPVAAGTLRALHEAGIATTNFLTDDPWNRAQRCRWFLHALPVYNFVFTPRRANIADLAASGCRSVHYMPFAYDEELFFPERPQARAALQSDVFFAGGADRERVPYVEALIDAGLDLALYGNYWDRHTKTRRHWRGIADPATVRRGLSATKIALCLVRHANRDGNSMRTFEVPAVGACALMEDTPEHRELFGNDNERVAYFRGVDDMVGKARALVADAPLRDRLAQACHRHITGGGHTYRHRLRQMLDHVRGLHDSEIA